VLALCALAANFIPPLAGFAAAHGLPPGYFGDTARRLVLEQVGEPSVDAVQAAYILGITDWSNRNGKRAWMTQGIGIRSAPPRA
jgi:hypothetical protein